MSITKVPRLFFILLLSLAPAWAQSQNTENTLKLDSPDKRPAATLAAVDWLVGSWSGEAFGGSFEEDWGRASAGTMVSTFKLIHGHSPSMYEFQMLVEEEGSLTFKLKHFNADFSGWEEKDEFVSFPLVKLSEDTAWFEGLTYRRLNPDQLEVFVAIDQGDEVSEERLLFERARPGAPPASAESAPESLPESPAGTTRIYVGNLPFSTTEKQIREVFGRYGTVSSVRLATDGETGRSRGFGFVEMAEGAEEAIQALDGGRMGSRLIRVKDASTPAQP